MLKSLKIIRFSLFLLCFVSVPGVHSAENSSLTVTKVDAYPAEAVSKQNTTPKQRKQLRDPTITYNLQNGARYTGQWSYRDQPHGRGLYIAKNGDEYRGQFENGVFYGQGTYYYVTGDIYQGQWRKGKQQGQGVMKYKNGNTYEGRWANGLRHGKGVLQYRSGSRYEGDWKLGERHGRGMYVSKSGQRYMGEYAFNKPHGRGVQVESNGDSYTGTFSKGKRHGVGECAPRNGNVEICLFDRGARIYNSKLLERAQAYFEKNQPVYEFEEGIGFVLEDHYTKQRKWLTHEEVYWDTIEAMLSTQLRIKSETPYQTLSFVIDDYTGPGTYELQRGKFLASIGKDQGIGLRQGERMYVKITSDFKGVIEGTFSATKLMSGEGKQAKAYTIRNGQFEATKYVEPDPEQKSKKELIKQRLEAQYR